LKKYQEDADADSGFKIKSMMHGAFSHMGAGGHHPFAKPKKSPRESKIKPSAAYLADQEVSILKVAGQRQLTSSLKKKLSPRRDNHD